MHWTLNWVDHVQHLCSAQYHFLCFLHVVVVNLIYPCLNGYIIIILFGKITELIFPLFLLLAAARFNPYSTFNKCKICKQTVHQSHSHYCQGMYLYKVSLHKKMFFCWLTYMYLPLFISVYFKIQLHCDQRASVWFTYVVQTWHE